MAKQRRVGLHKQVSSIFKNVPICADDVSEDYRQKPELECADEISSETTLHALPTVQESESPTDSEAARSEASEPALQPEQEPAALSPNALPPVQHNAHLATSATVFSPVRQKLQALKDKLLAPKEGVNARKQRTMLVLIPVLFFVLVFVLFRFYLTGSARPNAGGKTGSTANKTVLSSEIAWEMPKPYPATLRDPMTASLLTISPPAKSETIEQKTDDLVVKGILRDNTKPSAVVGNKIVHEGDVVQGATVVKINRRNVEFEKDGKTWTQEVQRRIRNSVQESTNSEATIKLK